MTGVMKRKRMSDAERIASGLSKLIPRNVKQNSLKVKNGMVVFLESSRPIFAEKCNWQENKGSPCYCRKAELKFEAHFPDRKYLTRYSVSCEACYPGGISAIHLYCSYCDEILTGTIAGPGGKITDHLITIRHIYQEANTLLKFLDEQGLGIDDDRLQVTEYACRLEEWCEAVRFPKKTPFTRSHFDDALRTLRFQLNKLAAHQTVSTIAP